MNRRRHKSGYVLPLLLMLLALASVALSSVVCGSLAASMRGMDAAEELQHRWGMTSCQAVFLPNAEKALYRAEMSAHHSVNQARSTIFLNGQSFELIFSDEQAKANINTLYDRQPNGEFQATLSKLQGNRGARAQIELRPLRSAIRPAANAGTTPPGLTTSLTGKPSPATPTTAPSRVPPAFETLRQVFATAGPRDQLGPAHTLGQDMTCWGNGRININRASAAAIEAVCRPELNRLQVVALVKARTGAPIQDTAALLGGLGVPKDHIDEVERLLAVRSDCHSMWIIARSDRRTTYRFTVRVPTPDLGDVTLIHDW